MRKFLSAVYIMIFSFHLHAEESVVDLEQFAQTYFARMTATQAPGATEQDLESYLELLTDDIGHTHLPWEPDGSRTPDGKENMRKGMTFYLGAHTEYSSQLIDIFVFNHSAVAIRYKNYAKGIHPESKETVEYRQTMMEVLEMEDGKVAVIRKYHE